MRRRRGPVRRSGEGFVIDLGDEEAALVLRLLDELRQLLTTSNPGTDEQLLLVRLFPVVHPDDEQAEAEYQRLMRDELVESKLAAMDRVREVLSADPKGSHHDRLFDEEQLVAFMQSVNTIRLVLGTMLGVTDDPDAAEVVEQMESSPEYHLYTYLSWLLDHCVRAVSGA
jgi:hypothetical protein